MRNGAQKEQEYLRSLMSEELASLPGTSEISEEHLRSISGGFGSGSAFAGYWMALYDQWLYGSRT